jgi:hypothetical protein
VALRESCEHALKCSCQNISTTLSPSTRACRETQTTSTDDTLSFPSLPFLAPFLCSHRPPKPHHFDVWPGDSAIHAVEYFNVSARMRASVASSAPFVCKAKERKSSLWPALASLSLVSLAHCPARWLTRIRAGRGSKGVQGRQECAVAIRRRGREIAAHRLWRGTIDLVTQAGFSVASPSPEQ